MHKLSSMLLLTCLMVANVYSQDVNTSLNEEKINNWRISAGLGFGQRVANFDAAEENILSYGFDKGAVDEYIKNIKRGYKLSEQLHYMVWENLGLGLDYNFFHSSGEISGYVPTFSGNNEVVAYLNIEDNVYTNYIGPSMFSEYKFGKDRFKLNTQLSIGYTMYRDELLINRQPTLITGNTLGANLELGLEYFLWPNLSVGTTVCFFAASLSEVKIDDGYDVTTIEMEDDNKESLSRLDMSISVSYYF